ncbi:hypothetical protein [Sphingobacterium gobiense]|nr:hypothetical protein [Sphingobacterium gobiense]
MAIIYFFVLLKYRPTLRDLKKLIYIYTFVYILCWTYGMIKAPEIVFGLEKEDGLKDDRGLFRLSIPGRGFLTLCLFMCLNEYTLTKKKLWVLFTIALFLITVMHVIRQVILLSAFISICYLIRKVRYFWLYFIILVVSAIFIGSIDIKDDGILGSMLALTERQLDEQRSGEENVRITEYRYFFSEYSNSIITAIFGNGVPHSESGFGRRELRINSDFEFFANDVGYAEIFIRFGTLGLLIYASIFISAFTQTASEKTNFAKLFIIYIAIANFTASWVFHDVICLGICLYILERDSLSQKRFFRRTEELKNLVISNRFFTRK